jgi:two-component system sensor histidine kinase DesK
MKSYKHNHWAHFVPLIYFGVFFLKPILHHVGVKQWLLTILGTVVFLALYGIYTWSEGKTWRLIAIGGMVLAGIASTPWNNGGTCLFIFAAAFVPFVMESPLGLLCALAAISMVAGIETWLLHISPWFLVPLATSAVGGMNIHIAQTMRMNYKLKAANEEIEHLAQVAERERIARDLHDVLGHTLSVIILKSELAGKLIDIDPERAKTEMSDVEQASREALSEVRNTIRGYRVHSLEAELAQARTALATAGVAMQTDSAAVPLSPAQESVVALVVREAVTNVVRHAQARNCRVCLAAANGGCRLEIQDDGVGGSQTEGHGLRGMRERIEALGGTLERDTTAGTRLTVEFPLAALKGNGREHS